jgi:hypothetical protein
MTSSLQANPLFIAAEFKYLHFVQTSLQFRGSSEHNDKKIVENNGKKVTYYIIR